MLPQEGELLLPGLDDFPAAPLSRHKRLVAIQSMVEQTKFNIALLVLFIISIVLINAFFIFIILFSKWMRSSSKHLLIVGICVGDFLQGLLILPLIADLGAKGGANADCTTFQAVRLFADYLIPSITTLGIIVVNIDYLLRLSCNAYADGINRICILAFLIMLPWVVSCLLLLPLFLTSLQKTSIYNTEFGCHIISEGGYARALLVLSYVLYGCLLLVLTLTVAVTYLMKREYLGLDVCGERVHAPFDICLASFINILFYTPVFLITLLTTEGYLGCVPGTNECRTLHWVYTLALWLMFTKSWVLPMSWFFGRDTRAGIKEALPFC